MIRAAALASARDNDGGALWEAGSQMDWGRDLLVSPAGDGAAVLLAGRALFATGTGALLALGRKLNRANGRRTRLHLPSFFCMEVAGCLIKAFEIRWYRDLPGEPSPDLATIEAEAGDAVLALNAFGVRDGAAAWSDWARRHDRVALIEDHSHDPFSPWAGTSAADYAIASLRKTLPLPDGALLWSPKGLEPPKPQPAESAGAGVKLAGMILKRAYLDGARIEKDVFRAMELESEAAFSEDEGAAASFFTSSVLRLLRIEEFRDRRRANVRRFVERARERPTPAWRLLFEVWPKGAAPFAAILVCRDERIRDALKSHLIRWNVFPAVHWLQSGEDETASGDAEAIDLAGRILTLPCDQRYDARDVDRIFESVASCSV